MKKRSNSYWAKRQSDLLDSIMDSTVSASEKELSRIYAKSSTYLNEKIDGIFNTYKQRFELSDNDAKFMLNQIKSQDSLEQGLKLLKSGNLGSDQVKELLRELDAPSYRYRIQRLQKQLEEVDDLMKRLGATELNINNSNYINVANDAYNHGMFNLQKGVGYEFSFNGINEDAVQRILNSTWSGENYSQRIWQNADDLASTIKDEMVMGLLTGKTEREMAEELTDEFLVGYNKARRLIATESCFVYNDSIIQSYKDMGIEEYVFQAVHDSRTSKICRKLDRKVFKIDEAKVGVNLPPLHPWCRSVTAPKIDDDIEFKRRAYNPKTKEYEVVSDKENYKQWHNRVFEGKKPRIKHEQYKEDGNVDDIFAYPIGQGNKQDDTIVYEDKDFISLSRQRCIDKKIEYNKVEYHTKEMTEEEIINYIGGGDLTKGSCSSLCMVYTANKKGLDVLDFRGGKSQKHFSSNMNIREMMSFKGVESFVEKAKNGVNATVRLLKKLPKDKEYYMCAGQHAAIVKHTDDGFFYLELQSHDDNGWQKISSNKVLQNRFGVTKTSRVFGETIEQEMYAIDIDTLGNNSEFRELIGYINTNVNEQKKGASGYAK